MAYDISVPDVDAFWQGYETFHTEFGQAFDDVKRALSDLMLLESFQGAAATSAKTYFQEVHGPIITALEKLSAQIGSDLCEFTDGFSGDPVNEDKDARLPNDAMDAARRKLKDTFAASSLSDIDALLVRAQNTMSSVVSIAKPSVEPARAALIARGDKVEKLRTNVQGLEDDCQARLNSIDGFDSLVSSTGAAITHFLSDSFNVGAYAAGSFASSSVGQALVGDIGKVVEYQETKREKVLQASENVHQREHERLVEEQEKLQEERTWARVIGLAAVVVGVVATVATMGTMGPVALTVASVGLAGSMIDIKGRTDELMGDDDVSDWETASEVYEKGGKAIKHTDTLTEIFWGDTDKGIEDADDIITKWGVGYGTEQLYESMGYDENDSELAGKISKAGYDFVTDDAMDELVDKATKNGARNATRTAKISKAGSIVSTGSDLIADVADYAEDELSDQIEGVEREMDENARKHAAFTSMW